MDKLKISVPKLRDYGQRIAEEERLARQLNSMLYSCKVIADDASANALCKIIQKTEQLIPYFSQLFCATEDICYSAEQISRGYAAKAQELHNEAITKSFLNL